MKYLNRPQCGFTTNYFNFMMKKNYSHNFNLPKKNNNLIFRCLFDKASICDKKSFDILLSISYVI